ncbi:MAG: 6-phosphogluconolactonase, partial [Sulfobacillus sp.]|nr:6-phosphogluconolactonase [Sulfobacillus sp.]
THVAQLTPDTLKANARYFQDGTPQPTKAITMGMRSILLARQIILMAFGQDKAEAIASALSGRISTTNPASLLQVHPNVIYVLDTDAASKLHP